MKKNYPLWLRVALRLPLSWKRWIRSKLLMAEFWSTKLVIEDDTVLSGLIENTEKPDFVTFEQRLDVIREAWGVHDAYIESHAVRCRLQKFKWEHRVKVN